MQHTDNVTHGDPAVKGTVRPDIEWPKDVWKQVRKIAIDKGVPAKQLVVDAVVEYFHLKAA